MLSDTSNTIGLSRIGYSAASDLVERTGRSKRQSTGSGTTLEAGFVLGYALRGPARRRVSGSDIPSAVVELVEIFVLVFTGAAVAARDHVLGLIVGGEHATQLSGRFFSDSDAPGSDELEYETTGAHRGRTSRRALNFARLAPVAQGIEHRFPKPGVGGSNPSRRTTKVPAKRRKIKVPRRKTGASYTNHYTNAIVGSLAIRVRRPSRRRRCRPCRGARGCRRSG